MPSTQDIEARFRELCKKLDHKIENKEFDSEFDDLVSQLENEFMQINEYYNLVDREADRLFVAHNFWIRYAIWNASKSDASFIASYSTALILLLKRYLIKPYNFESLKRQLRAFTKYWILIKSNPKTDKRNVHVDIKTLLKNNDSLKELGRFLKNNDDLKESLSTTKLDDILYGLLRYQIYYALKLLETISWRASPREFNTFKSLLDELSQLITEFCGGNNTRIYCAKSVVYEGYFRLYKYKLFRELNKSDGDENKIKEFIKFCQDYSKAAERHYQRFKKLLDEDLDDSIYLGHRIDTLMAEYYKLIYVKKKIVKAIKKLGEVKALIMEKSLDKFFEDLKHTRHIRIISQEYILLQTYLKLLALYSDIVNLKEQLPEDYDKWVLELFDIIEQRLGSLVHEFHKYPKNS